MIIRGTINFLTCDFHCIGLFILLLVKLGIAYSIQSLKCNVSNFVANGHYGPFRLGFRFLIGYESDIILQQHHSHLQNVLSLSHN